MSEIAPRHVFRKSDFAQLFGRGIGMYLQCASNILYKDRSIREKNHCQHAGNT